MTNIVCVHLQSDYPELSVSFLAFKKMILSDICILLNNVLYCFFVLGFFKERDCGYSFLRLAYFTQCCF